MAVVSERSEGPVIEGSWLDCMTSSDADADEGWCWAVSCGEDCDCTEWEDDDPPDWAWCVHSVCVVGDLGCPWTADVVWLSDCAAVDAAVESELSVVGRSWERVCRCFGLMLIGRRMYGVLLRGVRCTCRRLWCWWVLVSDRRLTWRR